MSFKEKILLGFLAVLLIVSLIFIPKWQLSYYDNTLPKNSKDYIELEDKLRKTLIMVWGGLIVVLGFYLTYKRIKATEKQADVIVEGLITEQFTKAIDHLGAVDKEGNKNLEIRLGGITWSATCIALELKFRNLMILHILFMMWTHRTLLMENPFITSSTIRMLQ